MNTQHGVNEKKKLNKKQWEAVRHKDGPLLVIAGPGTGKTTVITHRIEHLIRKHNIEPEKILAITFTNKAAQEMQEGVNSGSRTKICTFHTFCHRILREHANEIGLDEDFTIFDQEEQADLLIEIVQELNITTTNYRPWRLLNIINNLKGNLQELTETSEFYENGICITDEDDVKKIRNILEMYQGKLEGRNALDFDDLIFKTVEMFREVPNVKNTYWNKISYILVDEYHDVNEAQYQLLKLLSTPSKRNLMVVADKDQAIYSWRGSNPQYIDHFTTDFTPHIIELEQHYRCTGTILSAAKEVIAKNPNSNRPSLKTDNPIGEGIVHCTFCNPNEIQEAQDIINLTRNLRIQHQDNSDAQDPLSIAILYRAHKFADVLTEQLALLEDTHIPFRRWVQPQNAFQEKYRTAVTSYLSLVDSQTPSDIEHAIKFPDMYIDELTLLQCKQFARQKGIKLMELLENIEAYPRKVGPMTRENIRQFWERIHKFVAEANIGNEKVSRIVPKLLNILELSRSPYDSQDIEIIENQPKNPNVYKARDILYSAVKSGERIHITAAYGIDEYCAAHILRQTLETYLDRTAQVQFLLPNAGKRKSQLAEKGVHLFIGDFDKLVKENSDTHILLIGTADNSNVEVMLQEQVQVSEEFSNITDTVRSITTLKLCQCLVGSFEIQNMEDTVVYDLETTGVDPKTANIVQIAACRLDESGNKINELGSLVKPMDGHIPEESTKIHGISEEDVQGEESIKKVLPKFCDFIRNSILVGHNIARYDNRILKRDMEDHLDIDLTNLYYDTLVTARRLFPHEKRSLEALAKKFNIEHKGLHQAGEDVEVNRKIFKRLIDIDFQKREMRSLTEFLPFVGLGILAKTQALPQSSAHTDASNLPDAGEALTEIDAFLNAAKHYVQIHSLPNRIVDSLPLEQPENTRTKELINKLRQDRIPNSPEDIEWKKERANMLNVVQRFEKISNKHQLTNFLKYQRRMMNAIRRFEKISNEGNNTLGKIERDKTHEQLTLMSLHTAKGTQFDIVIILGMEEGSFPQAWKWNPETIEEERRLFYVGMTRAKRRLYLVTSTHRFYENQGDGFAHSPYATYSSDDQNRAASMFIHEIPSDCIQKWTSRQRE